MNTSCERPGRADQELGAVAVLIALLAVVLFVMAAFAVDLGNAYAISRQLSVSADASALSAAQKVNQLLGVGTPCDPAVLNVPSVTTVATTTNAQNDRSGRSTVTSVQVTCTSHGVEVTVANSRTVPTVFAGVIGISTMSPSATATAVVQVPSAVLGGLRPIAACVNDVTGAFRTSSNFLVYISKTAGACGSTVPSQWGYVNFTDQGTDPAFMGSQAFGTAFTSGTPAYFPGLGSTGCGASTVTAGANAPCQSDWYVNGYAGPFYAPNVSVPGSSATGLAGNTGFVASTQSDVVGLVGKLIQLPVVTTYNAATQRFDVVGVVTVNVCAVAWTKNPPTPSGTTSCTNSAQPPAWVIGNPPTPLGPNEAALWVEPVTYATSGVFGGRTDCQIGDACDLGTRSIALFK